MLMVTFSPWCNTFNIKEKGQRPPETNNWICRNRNIIRLQQDSCLIKPQILNYSSIDEEMYFQPLCEKCKYKDSFPVSLFCPYQRTCRLIREHNALTPPVQAQLQKQHFPNTHIYTNTSKGKAFLPCQRYAFCLQCSAVMTEHFQGSLLSDCTNRCGVFATKETS